MGGGSGLKKKPVSDPWGGLMTSVRVRSPRRPKAMETVFQTLDFPVPAPPMMNTPPGRGRDALG